MNLVKSLHNYVSTFCNSVFFFQQYQDINTLHVEIWNLLCWNNNVFNTKEQLTLVSINEDFPANTWKVNNSYLLFCWETWAQETAGQNVCRHGWRYLGSQKKNMCNSSLNPIHVVDNHKICSLKWLLCTKGFKFQVWKKKRKKKD